MTATDNNSRTMAQLITEARRRQGLTQSELARRAGCKQSAISMLERGSDNALARPKVEAVLDILGLEHSRLPRLETAPPPRHEKKRRYCPLYDCPSNLPYMVNNLILLRPDPVFQESATGKHCQHCGEILENGCPVCGAPVNTGACCPACGTPYIAAPTLDESNAPHHWVQQQLATLARLGFLPATD